MGRYLRFAGAVAAVLAIAVPTAAARPGDGGGKDRGHGATPVGAVFVGTNHNNTTDSGQPPNQVAMYERAADGTLSGPTYYDTGGQGSGPGTLFAGDGLGAANSVKLSDDHRLLRRSRLLRDQP